MSRSLLYTLAAAAQVKVASGVGPDGMALAPGQAAIPPPPLPPPGPQPGQGGGGGTSPDKLTITGTGAAVHQVGQMIHRNQGQAAGGMGGGMPPMQ